ncbi:hypothetical protein [Bradyrhizobium japonicum]|uniref:hypothetical protein n=1 Tax=Bradyrhizobium japonicum TaxID=375 RepID=UPI00339A5BA2
MAAVLAAGTIAYKTYSTPYTLPALIIVGAIACLAAWVLSVALILSQSDRAMFGKFARALTQR